MQKYRATVVPRNQQQVLITLQLVNRAAGLMKSINFNVIDSEMAGMIRGAHEQDGVQLPHRIAPKMHVEIALAFAVDDPLLSHHLRGAITYMIQVTCWPLDKTELTITFSVKLGRIWLNEP